MAMHSSCTNNPYTLDKKAALTTCALPAWGSSVCCIVGISDVQAMAPGMRLLWAFRAQFFGVSAHSLPASLRSNPQTRDPQVLNITPRSPLPPHCALGFEHGILAAKRGGLKACRAYVP